MKRATLLLDPNSNPLAGLNFPDHIDNMVLAADTAEDYTIPTGARIVNLTADADFWARPDATAAIPTTEVADGTGSVLNPGMRSVAGVTKISFKSSVACKISIEVFS